MGKTLSIVHLDQTVDRLATYVAAPLIFRKRMLIALASYSRINFILRQVHNKSRMKWNFRSSVTDQAWDRVFGICSIQRNYRVLCYHHAKH